MIQEILASPPNLVAALLSPNKFEEQLLYHKIALAAPTNARLAERMIELPNGTRLIFRTFDEISTIRADCFWIQFSEIFNLPVSGSSELNLIRGELN